jgi:hypothetical protein
LIEAKNNSKIITMFEDKFVYAMVESVGKDSTLNVGDKVWFSRSLIGTEMSNGAYLMREDKIEFKIN